MNTVIGVFKDHKHAQDAVNELRAIGLDEEKIGVVAKHDPPTIKHVHTHHEDAAESATKGAAAGAAVGLGAGALWGLGIAAGLLPAIGPVIAGGTLIALVASAATGAAAGGIAGALSSLGVTEEEHLDYYEQEFSQGRVIVTVTTDRISDVQQILRKYGAYEHGHVH